MRNISRARAGNGRHPAAEQANYRALVGAQVGRTATLGGEASAKHRFGKLKDARERYGAGGRQLQCSSKSDETGKSGSVTIIVTGCTMVTEQPDDDEDRVGGRCLDTVHEGHVTSSSNFKGQRRGKAGIASRDVRGRGAIADQH